MKVAVDTNVFISTIIKPESHIGMIVVRMRNGDFTLLYSSQMLEEFAEVVTRDKIWKKYKLTDETFNSFVNSLTAHGERVEVVTVVDVCRDPDDNLLLSIALDGKADYIVSGDKDLLDLISFQNIPIIKPSEFLRMFEQDNS
jgi:putative PIN family toxin of toxin-antitoxin system